MSMMRSVRSQGSWGAAALAPILLASALAGCAPSAEEAEEAAAPEAAPIAGETAASTEPRVFFVEPRDGDTVTSPVKMVFGAENFVIEPVGDGEIHEGAGHYHIGLNTECYEPGVVIPQGQPSWIHFGDGSAEIEMQLPPGEATLCLQIGDGEHRTLEGAGMADVITIEVVEADEDAGDEGS